MSTAENRGNKSKRRHMYFRPESKRDSDVPPEKQEENYRNIFTQYCKPCMDKYGLESGKLGIRRIGICSICGGDGFLVGCLENSGPAVIRAHIKWTRENRPSLPESIYLVHTGETVPISVPIEAVVVGNGRHCLRNRRS